MITVEVEAERNRNKKIWITKSKKKRSGRKIQKIFKHRSLRRKEINLCVEAVETQYSDSTFTERNDVHNYFSFSVQYS